MVNNQICSGRMARYSL